MYPALRLAWRTLAIALVIGLGIPMCDSAEPRGPRRARPRPERPGVQQPAPAAAPTAAAVPPSAAPATAASKLEVIPGAGGTKTIAMEFYGLDIDHLLRLLSYAAQVTIVKSEQVSGPITVIAPEPVPLEVAFQILDSVLEVRGYTMVRSSTGIYKVLPIAEAIQSGIPIQFGEELGMFPPGDDLRTQVIPLENLDANDLASQLQGLLSENASLIPTSTNSLIITDTASNIHLAMELIADTEGQLAGGLKVYALQYYDATEMADLVTSIVLSRGGAAGAGRRPAWERRVVGRGAAAARQPQRRPTPQPQTAAAGPEFAYPDTRTNSLIVLATPIHLGQIENLVTQLDRPVSLRDSFFVYPVQNLVASDLAQLIAPLIGAQVTGGAGNAGGLRSGRGGTTAFPQRQQQSTRPLSGVGSSLRTSSTGSSQRPGQAVRTADVAVEPLAGESTGARSADPFMIAQAPEGAAPPAPQPAPQQAPPPAEAPAVEAPVPPIAEYEEPASLAGVGVAQAIIAADDNTNSLLISGPPEQIDLIQQMLEELDVLPPQVHIRAIIAEVELSRDTDLGFQWQSLGRVLGKYEGETFTGDVGTNFGVSGPTDEGSPSGLFTTLSGSQFQAVLTALTTDSKARILSAPSIFTTSNQAATIDISKQLPFPTGTFQSTTGAGSISTSISYRSVGIVLSVTPRVTQGNFVQMEVEISANEPGSEVMVADLAYPSFNQRLATAVVSVKDGNTVVVGGLMRETIGRSASRVPILGDLPLVGALFRSTKSTRLKSELLLFLTPRIVRTAGEAAEITESERSRLPDVPKSLRSVVGPEEPALLPSALVPPEPEEPSLGMPEVEPPVVEVPEAEEQSVAPPEPSEIEAAPEEAAEEAPEEAAEEAPEEAAEEAPEEALEGEEPVAPPPNAAPVEELPAEPESPPAPPE
ncbi:MAG: type II secretion system secretin GspD [Armatimonadetes bacterium]|nr:type II secretion system secretin GspD [Armatimonadota bacterium]